MTNEPGILSYGAYLPRLRLQRKAIAEANAWFAPALKGLARGERAMANWDEDSITMAVEAARNCLTGIARDSVRALTLASTTHPFDDRQNAAIVATALNLDPALRSMDVGGSLRAATSALRASFDSAADGTMTLLAAGEHRLAKAASTQEMQYGDGAAAVLVGLLVGFALTRDTTTAVPNVTDNELNVAIALLQQNGFEVGEVKRVEREAPANTVLEQDPLASPPAGEASLDCAFLTFFCSKPKVVLTVSAGPGSAEVPSTAGRPAVEAEEAVEDAGFEPRLERVSSKKVEEGLVINSLPSGGTTATRGSEVILRVSSGPKLAKVPVLVGSQRSAAVQQIRGRGFVPSVEERVDSAPAGEVISQAPSAGSQLPSGSTVSIVVSKGEKLSAVPNVIGKLRAEAVEAVRAAGLTPEVSEQQTEVTGQVGRVTDQFPPPGSELKPKSTVTLVVGKSAGGAVETEAGEGE